MWHCSGLMNHLFRLPLCTWKEGTRNTSLQLWPVTRIVMPCLKQLSEADKNLVLKTKVLQPAPFDSITVSWHSGTQIRKQSPTPYATWLSSSSVCLGLASPGELSPPPGFLILYFIASL